MEVWGNNRSVMPFDALGRTRATMMNSMSIKDAQHCFRVVLSVYDLIRKE